MVTHCLIQKHILRVSLSTISCASGEFVNGTVSMKPFSPIENNVKINYFFFSLFKKVFERNFYVNLNHFILCQIIYKVNCVQDTLLIFPLGDIERVGECLDKYWTHKKLMAHGCEPASVKAMMERIKPYAYGNSSCFFWRSLAKQRLCNCFFSPSTP